MHRRVSILVLCLCFLALFFARPSVMLNRRAVTEHGMNFERTSSLDILPLRQWGFYPTSQKQENSMWIKRRYGFFAQKETWICTDSKLMYGANK